MIFVIVGIVVLSYHEMRVFKLLIKFFEDFIMILDAMTYSIMTVAALLSFMVVF